MLNMLNFPPPHPSLLNLQAHVRRLTCRISRSVSLSLSLSLSITLYRLSLSLFRDSLSLSLFRDSLYHSLETLLSLSLFLSLSLSLSLSLLSQSLFLCLSLSFFFFYTSSIWQGDHTGPKGFCCFWPVFIQKGLGKNLGVKFLPPFFRKKNTNFSGLFFEILRQKSVQLARALPYIYI